MSLDLSPAPGAAPLAQQVRAQASMEVRLLLRNGEQLLLAVVIPVLVLVAGVVGASRVGIDLAHRPVDELTPGVLALAVMSTSFTSVAIATGFERRYGVLKRLGATPLPRGGLLAAKVLALLVVELLQMVVLTVVALVCGWSPAPGVVGLLGFVLAGVLGTAAFVSLGLLLAGTLRAEATLAAANLVFVLLAIGGGVVVAPSEYGELGAVLSLLPSGALHEVLAAALSDATIAWSGCAVLTAWAVGGSLLTARTFRWE
jgi:ABC-2 type transport system permease protein